MAGEARFTIEETDFVAGQRASYRAQIGGRFYRRLAIVALGTGLAMALFVTWLDGAPLVDAVVSGLLIAGITIGVLSMIVGGNYLKTPARSRRLFAQNRMIAQPQRIIWADDKISFESERGLVTSPLRDYHRWLDAQGVFLLYTDDQGYHLIPQRALSAEQLADLRATLVEHGPPRR